MEAPILQWGKGQAGAVTAEQSRTSAKAFLPSGMKSAVCDVCLAERFSGKPLAALLLPVPYPLCCRGWVLNPRVEGGHAGYGKDALCMGR